jgi:CheY-like chemotaxis protein
MARTTARVNNTAARKRPATAQSAGPAALVAMPRQRLHVLVVEQDPDVSRTIVGELQSQGHIATALSNCTDAWTVMQTVQFDLLIMDVETPAITPMELARRVTEAGFGTHMIATSDNIGIGNRRGQSLCQRNGFSAVISKAVPRRKFEDQLRTTVNALEHQSTTTHLSLVAETGPV